jgi:hypothetical protein
VQSQDAPARAEVQQSKFNPMRGTLPWQCRAATAFATQIIVLLMFSHASSRSVTPGRNTRKLRPLTKRAGCVYIAGILNRCPSRDEEGQMLTQTRVGWLRPALRMACLAVAAATLGGCVIEPVPYYHPRYYYHY